MSREVLSQGANIYSRPALGIQMKDSTAGFRAYRADAFRAIDLDSVGSFGCCFQIDVALRVLEAGHGITEIPIEFREREVGESQMHRLHPGGLHPGDRPHVALKPPDHIRRARRLRPNVPPEPEAVQC